MKVLALTSEPITAEQLREAIGDSLQTFDADRIVLFTHPESGQRYPEDVDVDEIEQRFGIPVDHAWVAGRSRS